MQQGIMHDYFLNPSGGSPLYDNPMTSLGIIGMDLGLAFFGQGAVKRLGRFDIKHAALAPSRMTKKVLIERYGPDKWKKNIGLLSRATGERGALGAAKTNMLRKKAMQDAGNTVKGLKANYASWGKGVKRLGIATAALGLLDLGFTLAYELATPGVDREILDRDRQQISNNEGMLDTRMAYTQRQRAIQAIHDSQLSIGRAMIGQEASHLHR
jgi:hypothetical protein